MSIDVARGADPRAVGWLSTASSEVVDAWGAVREAVHADLGPMGLAAGDRPLADVEVLAASFGACEYLLATRMHAAAAAGCLPFGERGGLLTARGWSVPGARRLARCAALVAGHPSLADAWAAGTITSEHVDPIARSADRFTSDELEALIAQLAPHWGSWQPSAVARFVTAADRLLHPPADPSSAELEAHASRDLSFALTPDSVLISAQFPRVEGELVIAAVDAVAERLRSTADHVPAAARRADALIQLINAAHAAGALPSRGGLPVSLTVTLEHTALGDPLWTTSRGHLLTPAEARWAGCDARVTPILRHTEDPCDSLNPGDRAPVGGDASGHTPAARIAALAAAMFDTHVPLAVGRTQRTATAGQRRALAQRDGGCVIPGCAVPAEACQAHHLTDWALGGNTDVDEMVLLCWAHHRQVDLNEWTIAPGRPSPGHDRALPGTPWPANNNAPFTVTRVLSRPRRT